MAVNKKFIFPLTTFSVILLLLLLAVALIPIDTKSVRVCGEIKTRYSLVLGQKDEFESIKEYSEGDLYEGTCSLNYSVVNLYII